jgi:DNA replication protein DnaC
VRFFSATGPATQLLERRQERDRKRFHEQLDRLHLIVLDELGYVPFSKAGAELLFDVVSRAYERTSLIVTSNLPFESWTGSLTASTPWKPAAKATACAKPEADSRSKRPLPPGKPKHKEA